MSIETILAIVAVDLVAVFTMIYIIRDKGKKFLTPSVIEIFIQNKTTLYYDSPAAKWTLEGDGIIIAKLLVATKAKYVIVDTIKYPIAEAALQISQKRDAKFQFSNLK